MFLIVYSELKKILENCLISAEIGGWNGMGMACCPFCKPFNGGVYVQGRHMHLCMHMYRAFKSLFWTMTSTVLRPTWSTGCVGWRIF